MRLRRMTVLSASLVAALTMTADPAHAVTPADVAPANAVAPAHVTTDTLRRLPQYEQAQYGQALRDQPQLDQPLLEQPLREQPLPTTVGCQVTLAARLNNIVNGSGVGSFAGIATSGLGGVNLQWSRHSTAALAPASVTKLLTARAALFALPLTHRQATTVSLTLDGSLVIHGKGDITLSRRASGPTFYRNAARLSDLAQQVSSKFRLLPIKPKRIIVDTSFYSGPTMAPGWDPWDIGGGSISPIVPAMLDGGRIYDTGWYVAHTANPSLQLGATLAQYLGLRGLPVTTSDSAPRGLSLGTVYSAPLADRLHDMLLYSDNVLAESIGREVAAASARPKSFSGAASAVLSTLALRGLPVAGSQLWDTSGLSDKDRLTPTIVAGALTPRTPGELALLDRHLYANLPLAGHTGTLRYRFPAPNPARGHLLAKTGSLAGVSTLAGTFTSGGKRYFFAFLVNNTNYWTATNTVDKLATTLYSAGC